MSFLNTAVLSGFNDRIFLKDRFLQQHKTSDDL